MITPSATLQELGQQHGDHICQEHNEDSEMGAAVDQAPAATQLQRDIESHAEDIHGPTTKTVTKKQPKILMMWTFRRVPSSGKEREGTKFRPDITAFAAVADSMEWFAPPANGNGPMLAMKPIRKSTNAEIGNCRCHVIYWWWDVPVLARFGKPLVHEIMDDIKEKFLRRECIHPRTNTVWCIESFHETCCQLAIQGEEYTRAVFDRLKRLEFFAISIHGTTAIDVGVTLIDDVDPVVDVGPADCNDDPSHDRDFEESGGGGGAGSSGPAGPSGGGSGFSGTASPGAGGQGHAASGAGSGGPSESELPILEILDRGLRAYRKSMPEKARAFAPATPK